MTNKKIRMIDLLRESVRQLKEAPQINPSWQGQQVPQSVWQQEFDPGTQVEPVPRGFLGPEEALPSAQPQVNPSFAGQQAPQSAWQQEFDPGTQVEPVPRGALGPEENLPPPPGMPTPLVQGAPGWSPQAAQLSDPDATNPGTQPFSASPPPVSADAALMAAQRQIAAQKAATAAQQQTMPIGNDWSVSLDPRNPVGSSAGFGGRDTDPSLPPSDEWSRQYAAHNVATHGPYVPPAPELSTTQGETGVVTNPLIQTPGPGLSDPDRTQRYGVDVTMPGHYNPPSVWDPSQTVPPEQRPQMTDPLPQPQGGEGYDPFALAQAAGQSPAAQAMRQAVPPQPSPGTQTAIPSQETQLSGDPTQPQSWWPQQPPSLRSEPTHVEDDLEIELPKLKEVYAGLYEIGTGSPADDVVSSLQRSGRLDPNQWAIFMNSSPTIQDLEYAFVGLQPYYQTANGQEPVGDTGVELTHFLNILQMYDRYPDGGEKSMDLAGEFQRLKGEGIGI